MVASIHDVAVPLLQSTLPILATHCKPCLTHCGGPCSSSSSSLTNMAGGQHMSAQHHRRQPEEDIFSIIGGVELEADSHPPQQSAQLRRTNNASTNSLESAVQPSNRGSYGNLSLLGDIAAEEQPSRILFIRGLDATVSDEALVQMFEVKTLLWVCYR